MTAPKLPRPPQRVKIDPHMVARATREQRAPATAHVTARPPATPGRIAYSLLGAPVPPRRQEVS